MLRTYQKRHPAVGARPGTLVIPPAIAPTPVITVDDDDGDHATTEQVTEVETLRTRESHHGRDRER